jgi:hypothetical protein
MLEHEAGQHPLIVAWPTCNHVERGELCTGRRVDGFDSCLAHINDEQLDHTLARLHPGASLDASGTPINATLLSQILHAVQNNSGSPEFGLVSFTQARFSEDADFSRAKFTEDASFDNVTFERRAIFIGAAFNADARFSHAQFGANGVFGRAIFNGTARFGSARFSSSAIFRNAHFDGSAIFGNTEFSGSANFGGVQFNKDTRFGGAQFQDKIYFLSAKFGGSALFQRAQFATAARFRRAQFVTTAAFNQAKFDGAAAFVEVDFGGNTAFDRVQFSGNAVFHNANFGGRARFDGSHFSGGALLDGARFRGNVSFDRAQFSRPAMFRGAQFSGDTTFSRAEFHADTAFNEAQFNSETSFNSAHFCKNATFDRVRFHVGVTFDDASFEEAAVLGPLAASNLSLRRAVFSSPLLIDAVAANVICHDAHWRAGVVLRLRFAVVDLERATFTMPSFVSGFDHNFQSPAGRLDENQVRNQVIATRGESPDTWIPVLLTLRGVDAFNLSVTDVDLSQCRFAGARVLDQLRLEGRCIFDHPPDGLRAGWAWPPVWRWSSRQSLVEERIWRATTPKHSGWAATRSGKPAEVRPERLAGLYRQLRKAQEDAKNEPGAADLYYGEMEMRRLARTTPVAERGILWVYWLISGYGLRALRSLGALVIIGLIVTIALIGWGLGATAPITTPPQHLAGTVTTTPHKPAKINAVLSGITPELPLADQRWTSERAGTALEVTLESFVFRSTDQPLTSAGTWTTIIARILGPVLLALSLLAVRNRVKR